MSRKFKSLICLFIFLITLSPINVKAAETKNIKDYLNYLSEPKVQQLQGSIDEIANKYNLDTVIVITDNTEGKTSMEYADDFYDYNNYGFDSEKSGILLLVNMDAREIWISTTGKAINIFSDTRIDTMINEITSYLSDGDYEGASRKFLERVDYYGTKGVVTDDEDLSIEENSTPPSFSSRLKEKIISPATYAIALIISLLITLVVTLRSKRNVTVNNRTYEDKGSFSLTNKQDIFVGENTTRRKIQKQSNNSSHSTTHTSSSGSTHGGGGGSF